MGLNAHQLGDVFAYEFQGFSDDPVRADRVMQTIAGHIAALLDDDDERASFVSVATMSGLRLPDLEQAA
jgi:hypothetical protein